MKRGLYLGTWSASSKWCNRLVVMLAGFLRRCSGEIGAWQKVEEKGVAG